MNRHESAFICLDGWDAIVNDLDALDLAIEEVCDAETIARIKARKEKLKGAKP